MRLPWTSILPTNAASVEKRLTRVGFALTVVIQPVTIVWPTMFSNRAIVAVGILAGILASLIFKLAIVSADSSDWQASSLPVTIMTPSVLIVEVRTAMYGNDGVCDLMYSARDHDSRISVFKRSGNDWRLLAQTTGYIRVESGAAMYAAVEYSNGRLPCSVHKVTGLAGNVEVVVFYNYQGEIK